MIFQNVLLYNFIILLQKYIQTKWLRVIKVHSRNGRVRVFDRNWGILGELENKRENVFLTWYVYVRSMIYSIIQVLDHAVFLKKQNNFTHFSFVYMIFLNSIPTFMSGRLLTGI